MALGKQDFLVFVEFCAKEPPHKKSRNTQTSIQCEKHYKSPRTMFSRFLKKIFCNERKKRERKKSPTENFVIKRNSVI